MNEELNCTGGVLRRREVDQKEHGAPVIENREAADRSARLLFGLSVFTCLAGSCVLIFLALQMAVAFSSVNARSAAAGKVALLDDVRSYYSENILPVLQAHNVPTSHEYHDVEGAVPVPATITKEMAARSEINNDDVQFGFLSRYPFIGTDSVSYTWPEDLVAIDSLHKSGDAEYIKTIERAGQDYYYYARAVYMTEGCVSCHNSHPASTKTDWKVGDFRGITRVATPVVPFSALEQLSGRFRVLEMIAVLMATFLTAGVLFWTARRVSERQKISAAQRQAQSMIAARRQMNEIATRDALTGLPNRFFLESLFETLESQMAPETEIAILQIDLDRFKPINDTLGHAAGDHVLRHVAGTLQTFACDGRVAARIGGDEFVILAPSAPMKELEALAGQVIEAMNAPVMFEGHACHVGASVGIAVGADPKQLLVDADVALYRAKERGRGRVAAFSKDLQDEIRRAKELADDILDALANDEFVPVYQPQFDAQTLQVVGIESLVRWDHPRSGRISPDGFLGMARDLGVESDIDASILKKAMRDYERLVALDLAPERISVNISEARLHDLELPDRLAELDLSRGALTFELLETALLDDCKPEVRENIRRIKDLGIEIEIDDFGSGHASILGLLSLNPSRLKIDRMLIDPIVHSASKRKLVEAVFDIGRSLDVKVTAEGVASFEHVELLRAMQCDVLQGFYLASPMPFDVLVEFLTSKRRSAVA